MDNFIPLQPSIQQNDKKARWFIFTVSAVVFAAVVLLSRYKLKVDLGFNVHIFALINVVINSIVTLLLPIGLIAVKQKRFLLHKRIMMTAIVLSILFLISYIAHHLLAGETRFGDVNGDGILTADEKANTGIVRILYYCLLGTHIPLAAIILPFILFTAYRALTGDYLKHKKLVRVTWPVWFYVAASGVLIYIWISPYYH
jgi:putative membrane protein